MTRQYADLPELTAKFHKVELSGQQVEEARIEGQLVHVTLEDGETKVFAGYRQVDNIVLASPKQRKARKVTPKYGASPLNNKTSREKRIRWEQNKAERAAKNREAARNKGAGTKKQR